MAVLTGQTLEASVLDVLERVSGNSEICNDLDIALFDQHILDSFDMMIVIIEIADVLNIEISPAEVERATWATPRLIIAYLQTRLDIQ